MTYDNGTPAPAQPTYAPPAGAKTNTLAIVSLVSAFVVSLVAVITGHIALGQIKRTGENGRGLAVAGLVLGYLGLVGGVIAIVITVVLGFLGVGVLAAAVGAADSYSDSSGASTFTPEEPEPVVGGAPDPALAEGREWTGSLTLGGETVDISLDGADAPQAVASFVSLSESGFFDGLACHRLTTEGIYVLQCGDPSGDGTGGPGYSFGPVENDPADGVYPAGTIAMARVGNDGESNGSQFFLVYQDSTIPADSAGGYSVFGRITGGLDVVQGIAAAGVAGGGTDGVPAADATIGSVVLE